MNEERCIRCGRPGPDWESDDASEWEVAEGSDGSDGRLICPGCLTAEEIQAMDEDMEQTGKEAEALGLTDRNDDRNEALGEYAHEALGTYIGPASSEELLAALHNHELATVALFLQHPDGNLLLHTHGTLHYPDNYDGVYTIGGREDNPPRANDVIDPSAWFDLPRDLQADRYTGGARIHLPGGVDIVVILWQDVWHETESGDVAPGLS